MPGERITAARVTPIGRALDPEEIACFRRDGYVVVPGMFGLDEIRSVALWVEQVAAFPEEPGRAMIYFEDSLTEAGKRVLSRIENFVPYHEGLNALVNHGPLAELTAQLFGEPAIIFKDKINYKMPGGDGFAPHQDIQAGWDRYADLHITALVSIDESTVANGCLEMVAGHHDRGLIGESWRPMDENDMAEMTFVHVPTRPGDVIFFDSFAPHRSGPNHTASPRRVLYITYNALSQGDHRAKYYADKRKSYPPDCERDPGKEYVFRV